MNKRITALLLLFLMTSGLAATEYLTPVAVAADPIDGYIYIANKTGRNILSYDVWLDSFLPLNLTFPADLSGVTLSPDRQTLYATTEGSPGILYVIDPATGSFESSIPAGHYPSAPLASSLAPEVFVCNQFADTISVVDVCSTNVVYEIPTRTQPSCIALSPDSTTLLVGHLIPDMPANGTSTSPYVLMYDTTTRELVYEFALIDGSSGVRGICISPDGRYAYVTHLVGRYRLPTTHIERGWIWTNAMTILDLLNKRVINTVLLDEVDQGAANPWPVSCTEDGKYLCIATAGSQELIVIDRMGMHDLLDGVSDPSAVPNDLGFLTDLRQRILLNGKGARSMVVFDRQAFIPAYFSDVIDVIPYVGAYTMDAYPVVLSNYGTIDPMQFHSFDLPASNAILSVSGVQFDSEEEVLTLWNSTNSFASWIFDAPKGGNYMVFLTASAPDSEGGIYELSVDDQTFAYPDGTVVTTDSWDDYSQNLAAEGIQLTEGPHEVTIRPLAINDTSLMNLKKLTITYSETDLERVGEILFNDATVCYQSWLSCASCHPDGRADGLNWDLGNDGLGGSPRNAKSLLHAHDTPPTTVTGVRPHAYASVRAGYKYIEFVIVPETWNSATDAYLQSMDALPSPALLNGGLSEAAQRGEGLFNTNCAACHSGPFYTASAGTGLKFDIGTGGEFDVPSLIEAWRTPPYFNDGGTATLREAVAYLAVGLSGQDVDDLTEYVRSLGPISQEATAYTAWQWVQNDAEILADDSDLDHDGIMQLIEYFHGTDPYVSNAVPRQCLVASDGQLQWSYPARQALDVSAMLQTSTNLTDWLDWQPLPYMLGEPFEISLPQTETHMFYRLRFQ